MAQRVHNAGTEDISHYQHDGVSRTTTSRQPTSHPQRRQTFLPKLSKEPLFFLTLIKRNLRSDQKKESTSQNADQYKSVKKSPTTQDKTFPKTKYDKRRKEHPSPKKTTKPTPPTQKNDKKNETC